MTPWQVSDLRDGFHRLMRVAQTASAEIQNRVGNGGSDGSMIANGDPYRLASSGSRESM